MTSASGRPWRTARGGRRARSWASSPTPVMLRCDLSGEPERPHAARARARGGDRGAAEPGGPPSTRSSRPLAGPGASPARSSRPARWNVPRSTGGAALSLGLSAERPRARRRAVRPGDAVAEIEAPRATFSTAPTVRAADRRADGRPLPVSSRAWPRPGDPAVRTAAADGRAPAVWSSGTRRRAPRPSRASCRRSRRRPRGRRTRWRCGATTSG